MYNGGVQTKQMSWACATAIAFLGLGCAIAGFVMFGSASSDNRSEKVEDYDGVVSDWNAIDRSAFVGVVCTVGNLTGSGSYTLAADTSADQLHDSNANELPSYSPLSYLHTGSIAAGLQWNPQAGKWVSDITLTCSGGSATSGSTIVIPHVELYKTDTLGGNPKQCLYQHKGSWYNNQCQVYYVASEICVKLSVQDGKWALNSTWGGYGCHYSNSWDPTTYAFQRGRDVAFGHGNPPDGPVALDDLQVRVRSSADPFLNAEELTQGKDDFGETTAEKVTVGIILEALAVFLCLPLGYRLYEMYRSKQQRKAALASLAVDHEESARLDEEDEEPNPMDDSAAMRMQRYRDDSPDPPMASTFGGIRGLGAARPASGHVRL